MALDISKSHTFGSKEEEQKYAREVQDNLEVIEVVEEPTTKLDLSKAHTTIDEVGVEKPVSQQVTDDPDLQLSQSDLYLTYKDKYPQLFDEDGTLVDANQARKLGIVQDIPDGPSVPTGNEVDPSDYHPSTESSQTIYNQPETVAAVAAKTEKAQMSRLGFLGDSIDEQEAEMSDLVSNTTLTADEMAEAMDFGVMDYAKSFMYNLAGNNAKEAAQITVEDLVEERKVQKVLQQTIDEMPDGSNLKKFLELPGVGTDGLALLTKVGNIVNYVPAALGDSIEFMADTVQKTVPDQYAAAGLPDPETLANDSVEIAGGALQTLDAFIPAIGKTIRLPSEASRQSAIAAKALNAAIEKQKLAKTKAEKVAAGREIVKAKNKLNNAVRNETFDLDIKEAKAAGNTDKVKNLQMTQEIADTDAAIRAIRGDAAWNRRMNASKIRGATVAAREEKLAASKKIAEAHPQIKDELIINFEEKTGKKISVPNEDGSLRIDPDMARRAGVETSQEIYDAQRLSLRDVLMDDDASAVAYAKAQLKGGVDVSVDKDAETLQLGGSSIMQPLLKPDKIDGLVSAIVKLKEKYPQAFREKRFKPVGKETKGKKYRLIDHLLELTLNEKLAPSDKIIDILNDAGISFEDYILTVVGSGSEAGKILQQLSMLKRARPTSEMVLLQEAASKEAQGSIRQFIMRLEGARRGGLVSKLATAARNVQSFGIRVPLESVGNILDTALYNASKAAEGRAFVLKPVLGTAAFTKSLNPIAFRMPTVKNGLGGVSPIVASDNFRDSFRSMRYIFSPDASPKVREVVDFLMENPKFDTQFKKMFAMVNEIEKGSGRVDPKILEYGTPAFPKSPIGTLITDGAVRSKAIKEFRESGKLNLLLNEYEDVIQVLNAPNRFQEFLIRRGTFFSEIERLVRREYKIDFIDALENGKLDDLLNDASTVRPEGARSFMDIVDEASSKAMDVTYGKMPDFAPFREITQFITRNGFTTIVAFPRFMFNNLELLGQYGGGASWPITRGIASLFPKSPYKGPFTFKDRQRISRNIVGWAAVYAAYKWRTSDAAEGTNYKELPAHVKAEDGRDAVIDTTAVSPARPILWAAEAMKQLENGTYSTWNDKIGTRGFVDTFGTVNVRRGPGASLIEQIATIGADADLRNEESIARTIAKPLAQFRATYIVPLSQIIDAQRAFGGRTLDFKEYDTDPTLDFKERFDQEMSVPGARMGITMSAAEEKALPEKVSVFQKNKQKVGPFWRLLGGVSMTTENAQYGQYLSKFGFTEFDFASKSKIPSIENYENARIRDALPIVVEVVQGMNTEQNARNRYAVASDALKAEQSEEYYVKEAVRTEVERLVKGIKEVVTKGSEIGAPNVAYATALQDYTKLGSKYRRRAMTMFLENENRKPRIKEVEELYLLTKYGEAAKKQDQDITQKITR